MHIKYQQRLIIKYKMS